MSNDFVPTAFSIDSGFDFEIEINENENGTRDNEGEDVEEEESIQEVNLPQHLREQFDKDGFIVIPNVIRQSIIDQLNIQLEQILRGHYNRNQKPDKAPKLIKDSSKQGKHSNAQLGFSGNTQNVKVLQIINVHKCNALFRKLATSKALGKLVAQLANWTNDGTRLGQDQVWAKPPGASPLVFHRDSPYFMFQPAHVITVWVALDTMDAELGPLEYVKGSHKWGEGRVGSANQFFQGNRGTSLVKSAAEREGLCFQDLDFVTLAGLQAGGIAIHNGRTWHGSGKNHSKHRPRRGLGLHFVPANVKFTHDAKRSKLWNRYLDEGLEPEDVELPGEDFPVVWKPETQL